MIASNDEKEELTEQEERNLPSMITKTLGLDHEKIMNSVSLILSWNALWRYGNREMYVLFLDSRR